MKKKMVLCILVLALISTGIFLANLQINFIRQAQFRIGLAISDLIMLEMAPEEDVFLVMPVHWKERAADDKCGSLTRDCVVLKVDSELKNRVLEKALERVCAEKYSRHKAYKYFGCRDSETSVEIYFVDRNGKRILKHGE